MSINLSASKLALDELSSSTKFDSFVQAVQDALNNIGNSSYGAWASGLIFDPAKIKQSGATSGQVIMWNGSAWVPTSPPGSVYTLISDSTLGVDGTFSFTGIANSYKHLVLVCYLRSDRASTEDDLKLNFNNDTAANYDGYSVKTSGTGPTLTASESFAATSLRQANALTANSATASVFSSATITIPHYAGTSNQKAVHGIYGKKVGTATGNLHAVHGMGGWRSTAAINRIDIAPVTGANFKTGSRATLYGL